MWKTEIRYVIYEIREGLLKEPEDHWDDRSLMFGLRYKTQEEALQAIQKEQYAPSTLVVLPKAVRYWE